MLKQEFARLFRKQHFAVLGLLYLIIRIALTGTGLLTAENGNLQKQYRRLLEPFAGQITQQTEQMIESRETEILQARSKQNKLRRELENGTCTPAEYAEGITAVQAALQDADAFEILYQQYQFADQSPKNRWLLDRTGWESLLGSQQTDFPLVLVILMLALLLFCTDAESRTEESISACWHGRSGLLRVRVLTGAAVSAGVALLSGAVSFFVCVLRYGLPLSQAPIQSLQTFSSSPYALTLRQLFFGVLAVQTVGAVCLFLLFGAAALLTKRVLPAAVSGILLFAVPFLLFSGDMIFRVPFVHGLLAGNGYFRGDSEFAMDGQGVVVSLAFQAPKLWNASVSITGCILIAAALIWLALHIRAGMLRSRRAILFLPCAAVFCTAAAYLFYALLYSEPEQFSASYTAGHGFNTGQFSLIDTYDKTYIPADGEPLDLPIELTPDPDIRYGSAFADDGDVYLLQRSSKTGLMRILRYDLPELSETEIYRKTEHTPYLKERSYYLDALRDNGIRNLSADEMFREQTDHFWLDGSWLYLESATEIGRYHLRTHRYDTIMTEPHYAGALVYAQGRIYYIDPTFSLCAFEIQTGRLQKAEQIFCTGIAWDGEALVCRSIAGTLIRVDAALQEQTTLSEIQLPDSSRFSVYDGTVYFVGTDGKAYCARDGSTSCVYDKRPLMQIFAAGNRLMLYFADQQEPMSELIARR